MAATLGELRDALASVLEDAYPAWNVMPIPPDNVDVPAIIVGGFNLDTATFGDASTRVTAELQVMVSRRHQDQVELLDAVLGPSGDASLWQTMNDDPTLGDVVAFCTVQSAGDYREFVIADVGYYAATVTLSVML